MPFIGQQPLLGTYRLLDSITTSATTTFALTVDGVAYTPASAQNLIVSLNGVTQAPQTAYTIEDSNIVFATALTTSDVIDYIMALGDVLDVGTISDGTVTNAKLQNGAVTASKMTIDGHLIPTANVTYDLGTNDLRFRDIYLSGSTIKLGDHSIAANGTHISMAGMAFGATAIANNFTIQNDLTVGGDFVVNGNTTTIAASELKVEDSLIQLASNNEVSDTVDIGFIGHYYNGSSQLHTGFFRDATDGQYYLFTGYDDASFDTNTPPATIDRTSNTFAHANLNIGGLTITSETDIDTGIKIKQFVANNVADGDYNLFSDASRDADLRLYDYTNSTDILYFEKSSTHVGIGTNDPSAKLDIRQEKTGGGVLLQVYNEDNSDTTTQVAGIALGPDTRGGTARITAVKENADFSTNAGRDVALTFSPLLNNGQIERMRIASSGNVGIGESSPDSLLHIKSTAPDLILEDSDTGSAIGSSNRVRFRNSSGTFSAQIGNDPSIDSGANFTLGTLVNYPVGIMTNGSTKMVVDSNGFIGIGTDTPDCGLEVGKISAVINTNEAIVARFGRINSDVAGIEQGIRIQGRRTDNANRYADLFVDGDANALGIGIGSTSSNIRTDALYITTAGNVGINITDPNYPLDVSPSSPALGTTINNSIGLAEFYHNNGNASYLRVTGVRTSSGSNWTHAGTRIQQVIDSTNQAFMEFNGLAGNYQWGVACGSNPTTLDLTLTTGGNLSITGTFTESSALRYKENVEDLPYNNIVSKLRPVKYNKIGQENDEVGLIAEEVEALDKTLVTYKDGEVEGIQYTRLVPHLIAHIQKLEERLAAIENG